MYGITTGTSNLRKHLVLCHEELYVQKCQDKGWTYGTPKVKEPTIGENRKSAIPPFTAEGFVEYIVRWVTADDQVSVKS